MAEGAAPIALQAILEAVAEELGQVRGGGSKAQALAVLVQAFGADGGMILRTENTDTLRLAAEVGEVWDEESLPPEFLERTYAELFKHGRSTLVGPGEAGYPGSVVGAPLKLGPKQMGGVFLTRLAGARPFAPEDRERLAVVATAMAIQLDAMDVARRTSKRRAELEAVHAAVVDGILVVDRRGYVQGFNEAFKRLSRTPGHELYAWRWGDLLQPRKHPSLQPEAVMDGFFEAIFVGEAYLAMGVPAWLRQPDGQDLPVALALATVEDDEGKVTGGVLSVRDATLETELDGMKDDFIATVSHDLKTPLTSISGFVELLRHHDMPRDEAIPIYDLILDEGRRLNRMIADLLDLSKIQTGRISLSLERLRMAAVLERAMRPLRLRHEASHPIHLEVSPQGGSLVGDRDRLIQVVVNLVGNAIKYSPQGGAVRVLAKKHGKDWELSVQDQGMGIPEEALPRLFGRFFRVNEHQSTGTGLGLFITKSLVEAHGGRIAVHSVVGEGSTFTVLLPATPPDAVQEGGARSQKPRRRRRQAQRDEAEGPA